VATPDAQKPSAFAPSCPTSRRGNAEDEESRRLSARPRFRLVLISRHAGGKMPREAKEESVAGLGDKNTRADGDALN
jgi:hypothetical protein